MKIVQWPLVLPVVQAFKLLTNQIKWVTTRNGQAPIVTTQITINNPAPVQAPTVQVPYVPVAQAPIVQVPYGQAPPPPYKY